MTPSRWFTVTWVLVFTLSAAACGSGSSSKAPAADARSTIQIKDFAYSPTSIVAKVGDTVTVKNVDSTAHTVTADDGSFDTGNLGAGATATVKIAKSGQLTYYCRIHNYMKGVIQVS